MPVPDGPRREGASPILAARVAWILLVLTCLLTLPPLAEEPGTGLDPSWKLGLHLARDLGWTVGKDLFFTYGPWGYLVAPLTLVRGQWLSAVGFHLVAHLGLFVALAAFVRRRCAGWSATIAVAAVLLLAPQLEYRLLLALALAVRHLLGARKASPLWAGLLGAAAAAVTMIKFSMGLAAVAALSGAVVAAVALGRGRLALSLGAGYAVGLPASGLVALGGIGPLREFLVTSWEVTTGYAAAQERGGPLWQPVVVLIAVLVAVLGTVRDRRLRLRTHLPLALPAAGLLLLVFKHAFVRQETHAFLAFSVGGLLLTWYAIETWSGGTRIGAAMRGFGALALCSGALVLASPARLAAMPATLAERLSALSRAEAATRETDHRRRVRAALRNRLPLAPALREGVGDRTVDVLTVETAMVEAWELNWRPRRLLQSYVVGTSYLDDLDAEFFEGEQGPQRLLVDLQGLDTRHPLMDSPATWRAILRLYEPLARDSRWLLLGRRARPRRAVETRITQIGAPLNQAVPVPDAEGGRLEMRVRIRPSLLGRLVSLPWKLPEIRLALASVEVSAPRRIVTATAHRSFPLTFPWPETPADLAALFGERPLRRPRGLAFLTGGSWAWREAEVEFLRVEWLSGDAEPSGS